MKRKLPSSKDSAGFTIIETLIVLAIAAVIISLVFLVLPTFFRNSRNNQRKQDVAAILEAVSRYQVNDTGNFPSACGGGAGSPCNSGASSLLYYTKLSYYDATSANVVVLPQIGTATPTTYTYTPNIDTVTIYNYAKCDPGNPSQANNSGASYTDVVALYALEASNASAPIAQCRQL